MSYNQIDEVSSHAINADIAGSELRDLDQQHREESLKSHDNSLPLHTSKSIRGQKDAAKMNRQQQIAAEKAGAPISKSQPIFEQDFKLVKNSMVAMLQLLNEIKAELKNYNSFQKDDIKNEKKQWQKFFTEKADTYKVAREKIESVAFWQQVYGLPGVLMSKVGESYDDKQPLSALFPQIPQTGKLQSIVASVLEHTPENLNSIANSIGSKPAKLALTVTGSVLTQFSTSKNSEMQTADHTLQANQTMADGMKEAHRMTYDAMKEFDGQVSGAIEHLNQTIAELIRIEAKAYESRG